MPKTKILIIVNRDEAKAAYEGAVAKVGAAYDVAPSFLEARTMCVECGYSGLLIDLSTLVRCKKEEKEIAYNLINLYPSLRLMWEPKAKEMRLTPLEESFSSGPQETLRFFIEKRCASFAPRSLRKHQRAEVSLNLLLCAGESFCYDAGIKTFTVNISPRGAFIHTVHPFQEGDTVWLTVCELTDQEPIKATVRWSVEWGVRSCIPGIGVRFETVSESQMKEIRRYTGNARI